MTVTVKQVRAALGPTVGADSVGKNKAGSIVVRRGFFYRNGMDCSKFTARVSDALKAAGLQFRIVRDGEHYAPFIGGAGIARQSHWYVEIA